MKKGETKIPTAEEFLNEKFKKIYNKQPESLKSKLSESRYIELHVTGRIDGREENYPEMMIEFAKLHVQKALEEAVKNAVTEDADYIADGHYEKMINKESILNAYPLENIK